MTMDSRIGESEQSSQAATKALSSSKQVEMYPAPSSLLTPQEAECRRAEENLTRIVHWCRVHGRKEAVVDGDFHRMGLKTFPQRYDTVH
jgi:hypothetical protein